MKNEVVTNRKNTLKLQVRVTVLDKNDVAPTWGTGTWKFKVSEEAPPNTVVTVLKAFDPDTIGTLTYTLVPNHRPASEIFEETESQFRLHPTTGQLTLAEALDRETRERYALRVRADDGLQHTDVTLTVQVRGVHGENAVNPNRLRISRGKNHRGTIAAREQ